MCCLAERPAWLWSSAAVELEVSLIRFGGHLPRGGYDVQNGIRPNDTTRATRVH